MKKTIIAGAAASVLAAMPIAGVFAAESTNFVDTLSVEVLASCTVVSGGSANENATVTQRTLSAQTQPGKTVILSDGQVAGENTDTNMSVVCNSTSGNWSLFAKAGNDGKLTNGTTANDIMTGNAASIQEDVSSWAFKVTGADSAYSESYVAVPTTDNVKIAGGEASTAKTFTPSYQVYVAAKQAPGTYTGTVTYTLTYPAN